MAEEATGLDEAPWFPPAPSKSAHRHRVAYKWTSNSQTRLCVSQVLNYCRVTAANVDTLSSYVINVIRLDILKKYFLTSQDIFILFIQYV